MKQAISEKDIQLFARTVWSFYNKQGRHDLVWRRKTDPYSIVLSEIMLQQTQVARVEEYFKKWKKKFPNWKVLSQAKLSDVLLQWQGLGYNRRGKYVHDISKMVIREYGGVFPTEGGDLRALPGIGPYTQAAIEAFSFNERSILIETNIRTAVIYHFFKDRESVAEKEIEEVLLKCYRPGTKAYKSPREWNWALMDYGSDLKKQVGNLNKKSKTYTKQSRFEGSRRQLRSGILKFILEKKKVTFEQVVNASLRKEEKEIKALLVDLEQEGMIRKTKKGWSSI